MLLNADSSQSNYGGTEEDDLEIVSQQAGKTEESFHALIPKPVIDKKQVSYLVQQPKKNYASVSGLHTVPHGVSRARQEQLKHVIQEVPSSDTNEGAPIIAYQLHEYAEPKTYKFRKERHFRGEKRHPHAGRIKEPFGFSNSKGRTTIVKYTTNPEGGFRIEEVQ
ncbi:uncharacterized protein LOC119646463 [Hermetia illucens]|nr:uncharacterized protein LOC119646463 [Hermetia illucens]